MFMHVGVCVSVCVCMYASMRAHVPKSICVFAYVPKSIYGIRVHVSTQKYVGSALLNTQDQIASYGSYMHTYLGHNCMCIYENMYALHKYPRVRM